MRNSLTEVKTAIQPVETPDLQSMKLPQSVFFPLFQVWIRLEWILVQNPVLWGLGVTLGCGHLFGRTKFLMCFLFGLFSGFFVISPVEKKIRKSQPVGLLPVMKPRELNLARSWNGETIELLRRVVLDRIRWLRGRIRQVPKMVLLIVFLASEFYRTSLHSESRSIEFVLFFLPLLCLFFILFDISFSELNEMKWIE